jgi:hypothetical protein
VGLERDPLSRVSTTEELLGRKISDSGLERREYGRRDFHLSLSSTAMAETSSYCWVHLGSCHLKMETGSSLQNVVF